MARIIKSAAAEEDLTEIWFQIAEHNLTAADRMVDLFARRFEQLLSHPESGERCDRLQVGLRHTTVENYVVLYRISQPDIEILRVVHGARDLPSLFT